MTTQRTSSQIGVLVRDAAAAGEDVDAAVEIARRCGDGLPLPGSATAERWSVLAAVAEAGLTSARVLEAHADALAILAEAGVPTPAGLAWGVFAAESPGARLQAASDEGRTTLSGVKPWCSVAAHLDAALVTAETPEGRRLFSVDLRGADVAVDDPSGWVARGLRTVVSTAVHFERTPAVAVGPPGWYLSRPGFAWGGMGVAACWSGGARALLNALRAGTVRRPGELMNLHLGTADIALHAAECVLADAAARIDAGEADGADGQLLALRVRSVVAEACERALRAVTHGLGPQPLAFDGSFAASVADLQIYLRQHHGERDVAALGAMLVAEPRP